MESPSVTPNPITPVFAPDGSIRSIPGDQVKDALANGGKIAIQMKSPLGDVRYVPHDQVAAARASGGEIYDSQGTPDASQPKEGFWHSLGSIFGLTKEQIQASAEARAKDILQRGGGKPTIRGFLGNAIDTGLQAEPGHVAVGMLKNTAQVAPGLIKKAYGEAQASADAAEHGDIKGFLAHQIGGMGYTGAAIASPVLGDAPAKAGEQVGEGNIKGALGTATGIIAPIVAGGLIKGGPKTAPRSALSRTIKPESPVEFHAAEQSAIPKVNAAAQDLGQPIKTANDALAAIRQAKQNTLLDAHEAAGPGKTIADLPPEDLGKLQKDMSALDTLDQHIKAAQETAVKAKPQPTASESIGQIVKGGAKVAVGAAVSPIPVVGKAAGVLGLFKGTPEILSGVKNLLAKRALTSENLDAAVQQTFGGIQPEARTVTPSAEPGKPAFQPASDLSVQHEGNIAPPRQPHGEATVTPDEEPQPTEQTRPPYQPYAGDRTVTGTGTEPPAPVKQPLKATTPQEQTSEVLKKAGVQQALKDAGVAAPSATVRPIRPGIEVGPTLKPRMDLTFYGDKTGEGASLMQLTRYNINELRAMAVQRGLDVAPGETHVQLIEKIHDDLSPQEIKEFSDAAAERGRFIPPAKAKRGTQPQARVQPQAEEPPSSAPATPPERRSNLDYRQAIDAMSPEEQVKALYQSEKTGLPNKRAFDWAEKTRGPAKAIGMSDADGLKAMNDKYGYAAGDALLKAKADALQEAGLEAYHDKGDEFMFRGDAPEDLTQKLAQASENLRNRVIRFTGPDGKIHEFTGADFSSGVGSDLSSAEAGMKANKASRKAAGESGERGQMGKIKEISANGSDVTSPEFKKWFAGSKVADKTGKPLTVYHGTDAPFDKVDMSKGAQGTFWLTTDKAAIEAGESGATSNAHVLQAHVSIKNPAGWEQYENKSIDELIRDGYDGVILPEGGHSNIIAFEPDQVRFVRQGKK